MKNSAAFKLAGIPMQIIGGNSFAERLKDYFKSAQTAEESTPEIIISVVDSKEAMAFAEQGLTFAAPDNGLQINGASFMVKPGRCNYRVDDLFVSGKPVHIWVYYEQRTGVRKAMRDVLANFDPYSIGREGEEDRFIGDFLSYSALWWILALALMKYDRVFVHCGAVSKGGKAFVLSGTGGVRKNQHSKRTT